MLRLLRWLITGDGHLHEWEIDWIGDETYHDRPIGKMYILQCKHCGDLKNHRMRAGG